jgi:hypothetical protein
MIPTHDLKWDTPRGRQLQQARRGNRAWPLRAMNLAVRHSVLVQRECHFFGGELSD